MLMFDYVGTNNMMNGIHLRVGLDLVLLEELTPGDFNYFRPATRILEEDERIRKLSDQTLSAAAECILDS